MQFLKSLINECFKKEECINLLLDKIPKELQTRNINIDEMFSIFLSDLIKQKNNLSQEIKNKK